MASLKADKPITTPIPAQVNKEPVKQFPKAPATKPTPKKTTDRKPLEPKKKPILGGKPATSA